MPQQKSKRYTPPTPTKLPPSKLWVPVAMATLMGLGLVILLSNYLGLLPGPDAENRYLVLGLALISSGFLLSTNYR